MERKINQVKSLYKAMKVLECFTVEQPELSITEISCKLGLYKSNVYNILSTFEQLGYVSQNPENSKYRLGIKILNRSFVFNSHMSIQRIALPHMQRIADSSRENVYLAVPNGTEVVYLESCCPYGIAPSRNLQGERAPMYCTAIGKAMLAYSPQKVIDEVYKDKVRKFTEQTITKKSKLEEELKLIQSRGYAIDDMEHEYGIRCVGMAIKNSSGEAYAGLSVSGPSPRIDDKKTELLAGLLQENIRTIEEDYKF
ncbi:IclR family transcriptional regulator [Eubacteriales bacterium mix99]|jgi:DNA-binding IclR family transcriptional regulator